MKAKNSREIVGEVQAAVRSWRREAKRMEISRAEQDRMATEFRLAQ